LQELIGANRSAAEENQRERSEEFSQHFLRLAIAHQCPPRGAHGGASGSEKSSGAGEPRAGAEAGFYKREWRAVKKEDVAKRN
jgi:hypothetical protein